ncbi:caspase, EACC1-associated type [Yinghuangia seranimata]|uniref:caspase, EACC1-associated type n=1 Tax=Yinghuangia seranimata TaxID=408067 RepID=UPI00248C37F3|nr:PQQ-binding-like beta-propeller repeat protein [Yinghuangia seranimata]MDI2130126.1 PQQ-binding-like beta-propeller repeat protein [Yinghuangia seranimata]
MTVLPDPAKSCVLLIGAHTYAAPDLPNLPAVARNLSALRAAFTNPLVWGIPPSRCVVLDQPESSVSVLNTLHGLAARAEDTLVVYYAGHGLTKPKSADLFLALPGTQPEKWFTALCYDDVADVIRHDRKPAMRTVVIVDCCFSGRALGESMSGGTSLADETEIEGSYVLTATSATQVALSPAGERLTAFTGALVTVLTEGVDDGPELIDMDTLFRHLRIALAADGLPKPHKRSRDTAGRLALARNRCYRPPEPDPFPPGPPPVAVPDPGASQPLHGAGDRTDHLGPLAPAVRVPVPGSRVARWSRRLLVTVLVASLGTAAVYFGPGLFAGGSPSIPTAKVQAQPLWKSAVVNSGGFETFRVLGDLVVTAAPQQVVEALAADSGQVKWQTQGSLLDADRERGTLIRRANGDVALVDSASGKEVWGYAAGTPITSARLAGPLTVVLRQSDDGATPNVIGLNSATGKKEWQFDVGTGSVECSASSEAVLVVFTLAATNAANYTVSALDLKTGKTRWTRFMDHNELGSNSDICAGWRQIVSSEVFVALRGTASGGPSDAYALDLTDGSQAWNVPGAKAVDVGEATGTAYVETEAGLRAVVAKTGVWRWTFAGFSSGRGDWLTFADGALVVQGNGRIIRLDPGKGKPMWSTYIGTGGDKPEIHDGHVYVSNGDDVYSLALADGKLQWQHRGDGWMVGAGSGVDAVYVIDKTTSLVSKVGPPPPPPTVQTSTTG